MAQSLDIVRGADSFTKKSDQQRWRARCNRESCSFMVNAVATNGSETFKITAHMPHTCNAGALNERKRTWMKSLEVAEGLVHDIDDKASMRDVKQRIMQQQAHVLTRVKRGLMRNTKAI